MVTYKVFWVRDFPASDTKEYHGSYPSFDEAYQSITSWWHRNGFRPSLVRFIGEPGVDRVVTIDYGPHNMFYEIIQGEGEQYA